MKTCFSCGTKEDIESKEFFIFKNQYGKSTEEVYSIICKKCGNLKYGYSKQVDKNGTETRSV
jgi:hypothetical protein